MTHDPFLAKPRVYFGPSLAFDAPHLLLEAMLPAPQAEWPRLRADSIAAAVQLAGAFPRAGALAAAGKLVAGMDAAIDPWTAWIVGLARAHGVPDWPIESAIGGDGRLRLHVGCPYPAAVHWARVALHLLRLAAQARDADLNLPIAPWRERLERLHGTLPPRPVMALHRALFEVGLPWIYFPEAGRTNVGSGSRGESVGGLPRDPKGLARRLAARQLTIPVYTVTGSIGKTTTVRFLAQLLEGSGTRIGFTSSYGVWVEGRQIDEGDRIGPRPALRLLSNPAIDAAVLEIGRRGLVISGMPLRHTDVAVLLNVDDVQLGAEGIETVEQMAEVKAVTLQPARIAILNHDDPHCRRIGEARDPGGLVWFSNVGAEKTLRALSRSALGVLGVERDSEGAPLALAIWVGGKREQRLSLDGVAPFHGLLGEKTVEELLAAVGAAHFGPLAVPDIAAALPDLKLDAGTHRFRCSLHPRGRILFMLDKAAEPASMRLVTSTVEEICARHGIGKRIAVFCRAAASPPESYRASTAILHGSVDELVYFDRPDAYAPDIVLPCYTPGSLPKLMRDTVAECNEAQGVDKPLDVVADWEAAAAWLNGRLAVIDGPVLVLINQPGTAAVELSRAIVDFVEDWQEPGLKEQEEAV